MNENNLPIVESVTLDVELIKRTIAKGATDEDLKLFVGVCKKTALDPFSRQIYAVKRWDSREGREVMSFQVSIDGLRLVAQRSGQYEGQTKTEWCGIDGIWHDVWLSKEVPYASRVGVYRMNFREPLFAVALFRSYAQTNKEGKLNSMWARFPELMIGKVAEALALRKSFPQELSGLYTTEEMSQAGGTITEYHSEPSQTSQEGTEQAQTDPNREEHPEQNGVIQIGEVLPEWFWKLTAIEKKNHLPEGCKGVKENGVWICKQA